VRSYETHPFLSDLSDGGAAHEYTPDAVAKLTFTVALVEGKRSIDRALAASTVA